MLFPDQNGSESPLGGGGGWGGEREEGGDGRRETVPAFEWRIFPPALVKRGDRESTGRFHFKVLRSNY